VTCHYLVVAAALSAPKLRGDAYVTAIIMTSQTLPRSISITKSRRGCPNLPSPHRIPAHQVEVGVRSKQLAWLINNMAVRRTARERRRRVSRRGTGTSRAVAKQRSRRLRPRSRHCPSWRASVRLHIAAARGRASSVRALHRGIIHSILVHEGKCIRSLLEPEGAVLSFPAKAVRSGKGAQQQLITVVTLRDGRYSL
jgi:hypothetical protein